MSFGQENAWLKDFYLSKIQLKVRSVEEQEGIVRIRVGDGSSPSHLYVPMDTSDESGLMPRRFQAD